MRSLSAIAKDINSDWVNVNYAAKPYLVAMMQLDKVSDKFYEDSGKYIVLYFLSNAGTWRGPVAKTIKAELKAMIK